MAANRTSAAMDTLDTIARRHDMRLALYADQERGPFLLCATPEAGHGRVHHVEVSDGPLGVALAANDLVSHLNRGGVT